MKEIIDKIPYYYRKDIKIEDNILYYKNNIFVIDEKSDNILRDINYFLFTKNDNGILKKLKENNCKPLYITMRGSYVYGTNTETSDVDYFGIYKQDNNDILGFNYIPQISDDKHDIMFYEIKEYLELLKKNNPNTLEGLFVPIDYIVYVNKTFEELLLNHKNEFLNKQAAKSIYHYANSQLKKATGLNKKMNWEISKMKRKDILDFCFVIKGEKTIPFKKYINDNSLYIQKMGAVKVPNAPNIYAIFYDEQGKLYDGIVSYNSEGEVIQNSLCLYSTPKSDKPIMIISFNLNDYSQHCRKYNDYVKWLKNRNIQRYVDVSDHGQKIDGKNVMHAVRMLNTVEDISKGLGMNVRRKNEEIKYLLDIRKGKYDLKHLIEVTEEKLSDIIKHFDKSDLPEKLDDKQLNDILLKIRKS